MPLVKNPAPVVCLFHNMTLEMKLLTYDLNFSGITAVVSSIVSHCTGVQARVSRPYSIMSDSLCGHIPVVQKTVSSTVGCPLVGVDPSTSTCLAAER